MTGSEELAPVPPCSRGSSRHRIHPILAAAVVLLASGVLVGALLGPGAPAASASASGAPAASMSLTSQTSWVTGTSGTRLELSVSSALPSSRLGLNVVLYSRLGSRDAFQETLTGVEPASEFPLDSPATIPLGAVLRGGLVRLHLPVTTSYGAPPRRPDAPTLALDCGSGTCPGVYPLEIVLLDRAENVPLASLTTYLVYTPHQAGSLPLEVGLVLPLGSRPALSPQGSSLLGPSELARLSRLLGVIEGAPGTALSLAVHGQELDALARTAGPGARALLARLAGIAGGGQPGGQTPRELVGVPFASAEVDELAAAGLGSQLVPQLAAERAALAGTLHASAPESPYLAPGGLGAAGLRLLHQVGVSSAVIPPSSLATPTAPVSTPTAPFLVASGTSDQPAPPAPPAPPEHPGVIPRGTTEVFLSDPGMASAFDAASPDPVLAAHQFLAELASVYFDDPFSTEARGVVVAPRTTGSSDRFLAAVLAGLGSSPVLQATTLTGLLDSVPVGANGAPAGATLTRAHGGGPLDAHSVRAAETALDTVRSVVPSDRALSGRLEQSILLGESATLTGGQRSAYEAAPAAALGSIGRDLSLTGSRTTTLTSRSGRIPVTVQSSMSVPVHVLLRLRSSELTFSANRSVLQIPLDLAGKASQSDIRVSTRTSGSSRLDIALLSPRNAYVLVDETVAVHSTAISGVALVLSAGAVLVLLAWWIRSSARRRRQTRDLLGAGGGTPPPGLS